MNDQFELIPASALIDREGIRMLEAERIQTGHGPQLRVWCEHCQRHHFHGAGDQPGDGDGHRAAHCHDPESPYAQNGYRLREVRS